MYNRDKDGWKNTITLVFNCISSKIIARETGCDYTILYMIFYKIFLSTPRRRARAGLCLAFGQLFYKEYMYYVSIACVLQRRDLHIFYIFFFPFPIIEYYA